MDEAEATLSEAVSLCDALGLRPRLAETHLALSEVCMLRGERDRALYFTKRAEQGFASCKMPVHARRAGEQAARIGDLSDLSCEVGGEAASKGLRSV
jgi:hypothetical protein